MLKLTRYILYDIIRSKIVIAYTLFLLVVSLSMFRMEENSSKALLSLLNIILIVLPLISLVFSTIHYYNSYEFIELMLSQPMSRTRIILAEYLGVAVSLLAAFIIGAGIPVIIFSPDDTGITMILTGMALTLIFTSIAFVASVRARDKARGMGSVLLVWFYFALIYDGLILLILFSFSDYPLEKITLALSFLNPLDLGRIFIMLKMDVSALMGYTGALFKDFFGSFTGMALVFTVMLLWIIAPVWLAVKYFKKKDL